MHVDRTRPQDDERVLNGPDREDAQAQLAVMTQLLVEYPGLFALSELALELLGPEPVFCQRDTHERAVRDLINAGLLHRQGELVMPTRAARHFHALEQE